MNIGDASAGVFTSIALRPGTATGDGSIVLPAGSVSATEMGLTTFDDVIFGNNTANVWTYDPGDGNTFTHAYDVASGTANDPQHVVSTFQSRWNRTALLIQEGVTTAAVSFFQRDPDLAVADTYSLLLASNCPTNVSDGTEDCDVDLQQQLNSNLVNIIHAEDTDGGIDIGSASAADVTVATNGTGDSEVQLPANSIGPAEMNAPLGRTTTMVGTACGAATNYFSGIGACSATETSVDLVPPTAVTVTAMACQIFGDNSCTMTFMLRQNGADTGITFSFNADNANPIVQASDTVTYDGVDDTFAIRVTDDVATCTDSTTQAVCVVQW